MHNQPLSTYPRSFSLASLRTAFRRSASTCSTSSARSHISAPIISPSTSHDAKPLSYLTPPASPAYPPAPPSRERSISAHFNPLAAHPLGVVIPSAPASIQTRDHYRNSVTSYSPVGTIRSIMSQQLFVDLEEERRDWGREIGILEPRPVVFWGGMEEMLCL